MHGLINRTIQGFLRDSYGAAVWAGIATDCGIGPAGFEAMLHYPDAMTEDLLAAASRHLRRPRETILEDIGTWLISAPAGLPLRRLLRFGGVDFADFLWSLEELPGRVALALPDLGLPGLRLHETGKGEFDLHCRGMRGFGHVLVGMLRAMADDYGALVVLTHDATTATEVVRIRLVLPHHTAGRRFALIAEG